MPGRCVVGVDLGGTNVRAAAFFEDGSEAGRRFENPSRAQEGTPAILDSLARTIRQAVEGADGQVDGIGVAIPGHVDNSAGVVRWAPNLGETVRGVFHYWKDVPIREPLRRQIGIPISMDNDANLAALGEYRFGSGHGKARCLVMITLGTGFGGGVVMAPDAVLGNASGPLVLLGGNKGGAELGHVVVNYQGNDCNAGSYGALEAYCQRDAIVRRAVHRLHRGRASLLSDWIEGDLSRVTPHLISQAAEQGDELSIEVFDDVGTMLGVGIGNFINIFNPEIVAVGGQIAKAGKWLLDPARKAARNVAIPSLYRDATILQAVQIEDAGILGGAALALEALRWASRPA